MAARSSHRRASRLAFAVRLALTGAVLSASPWHLAAALTPGGSPEPAPLPVSMDLYLDVTVNGAGRGLSNFYYRDGALWADGATLRRLGFVLPPRAQDPIRIDGLNKVKVEYDPARQSVSIVAPLQQLDLPVHVLHVNQEARPEAAAARGAVFNYDLYGSARAGGGDSLGGYVDMRTFARGGVFGTTALVRPVGAVVGDRVVRMDTVFDRPFADSMLDLKVGDTLSSATSWSRPVRLGGIRFGTRFDLQPYFVTTPLPAFMGSVTLPSAADLYINGVRRYSGAVPAGPYRFEDLPVISGAGSATLVLTDSLGRQTTLAFPIYGTTALLRKGLSDWSIEGGVVRENYGMRSFDYDGDPVVSGTWRRGLGDAFTIEAHGEAASGLGDGGLGGVWLVGTAGVASASLTRSTSDGGGSKATIGYHWNNPWLNVGVSAARATPGYRDIAGLYGAPAPLANLTAEAGATAGWLGSVGVNYVGLRYPGQDALRYAGVFWTRALGERASLSLNANRNLGAHHDVSAFLSVGVSFARGTYINTGISRDTNGSSHSLSVAQSAPTSGGLGWLAQVSRADPGGSQFHVQADYVNPSGRATAGAYGSAGGDSAYAGYSGSLVFMSGNIFPGRTINDGFAVVSTNGVPDVPVRLENNAVGSTDTNGFLLVTNLRAYQDNRISIDPMQLDADMRIGSVNQTAVPANGGGVMVNFDIRHTRAARVLLVDGEGHPVPLGSMVRLRGHGDSEVPVGYDGETYLDALQSSNVLDVILPNGVSCRAAFALPVSNDGAPRVGPVPCLGAHP